MNEKKSPGCKGVKTSTLSDKASKSRRSPIRTTRIIDKTQAKIPTPGQTLAPSGNEYKLFNDLLTDRRTTETKVVSPTIAVSQFQSSGKEAQLLRKNPIGPTSCSIAEKSDSLKA